MRRLAVADLDLFIDLILKSSAVADNTRLSDVIARLSEVAAGQQEKEKDWDWFQKNDPVALQDMKKTDKARYDKLYAGYWK